MNKVESISEIYTSRNTYNIIYFYHQIITKLHSSAEISQAEAYMNLSTKYIYKIILRYKDDHLYIHYKINVKDTFLLNKNNSKCFIA